MPQALPVGFSFTFEESQQILRHLVTVVFVPFTHDAGVSWTKQDGKRTRSSLSLQCTGYMWRPAPAFLAPQAAQQCTPD